MNKSKPMSLETSNLRSVRRQVAGIHEDAERVGDTALADRLRMAVNALQSVLALAEDREAAEEGSEQ